MTAEEVKQKYFSAAYTKILCKNCITDISKHKDETILFADTHHITLFTHNMLLSACILTWFCDQTQ